MLVLLLPLAQAAAHWHLLSHVHEASYESSDQVAEIHLSQCDLCLTAVAVSVGAATAPSVEDPTAAKPLDAFVAPAHPRWLAPAPRPYQSRAPPSALI